MIRPNMSKSLHVILASVILVCGIAMASAPLWLLWLFRVQLPVPIPEPLLGCVLMVVPAMAVIQLASLATGKSCPFGTRLLVQSFIISACLYVLACVLLQA